jgi:hypothetical protein
MPLTSRKYRLCVARCRAFRSQHAAVVDLRDMRLGARCIALIVRTMRERAHGASGAASHRTFAHARTLLLADNRLRDLGAEALGAELAADCSLTHLNVERNGISASGLAALHRALCANVTLVRIDAVQRCDAVLNAVFTNVEFRNSESAAADEESPRTTGALARLEQLCMENRTLLRTLRGLGDDVRFNDRGWHDDNGVLGVLDGGVRVAVLDLSRNRIAALPAASLTALGGSLRELVLEQNHVLRELPPSVGALRELRVLRCARNALHALPVELLQCAKLQAVDVGENPALVELPPLFAHRLRALRALRVRGCTALEATLPMGAARAGDAVLIDWLRTAARSPQTVRAAPLTVVGTSRHRRALMHALTTGCALVAADDDNSDAKAPPLRHYRWPCDGGEYWVWERSHDGAFADVACDALFGTDRARGYAALVVVDAAPSLRADDIVAALPANEKTHTVVVAVVDGDEEARLMAVFEEVARRGRVAQFSVINAAELPASPTLMALRMHLATTLLAAPWAVHTVPAAFVGLARSSSRQRAAFFAVAELREFDDDADRHSFARFLYATGQCAALRHSASSPIMVADVAWCAVLIVDTLRAVRSALGRNSSSSQRSDNQYYWTHDALAALLWHRVRAIDEHCARPPHRAREWLLAAGVAVAAPLPEQRRARAVFFPDALDDEPSCGRRALDQMWQQFDASICIDRTYLLHGDADAGDDDDDQAKPAPRGFFRQVLVHLMKRADGDDGDTDLQALYFWRTGVALTAGTDGLVLLQCDNPVELRLRVASGDVGKYARIMHESTTALCSEHLRVNPRVTAPCPRCQRPLSLELLEHEALVARASHMLCPRCQRTVPLAPLLPELAAILAFNGAGAGGDCDAATMIVVAPSPRRRDAAMGSLVADISAAELTVTGVLGEGSYARVYKALYAGEVVAVKRLTLPSADGGGDATSARDIALEFVREAWIMTHVQHPNLVRLHGVCREPLQMVVEYMNGGSLYDYLAERQAAARPLTAAEQLALALDIARGLRHLHAATPPIIHRDVKSPNVLLELPTEAGGPPRAAVADFGLSRSTLVAPVMSAQRVENPRWSAPEVVAGRAYSTAADVYSYGTVLYELVARRLPYADERFAAAVERAVLAGERPALTTVDRTGAAPALLALMQQCWQHDAARRPTMQQIVATLRRA